MTLFLKDSLKQEDEGFVITLTSTLLFVLCVVAAFVVDYGRALWEERRIQNAMDYAAQAGATLMGTASLTYADVEQEVQAIAGANGVDPSEIESINCGRWQEISGSVGEYEFISEACDASGANAVQVNSTRRMKTTFARVMGNQALWPSAVAIAMRPTSSIAQCIKPFGIELSMIIDNTVEEGDVFTVGKNSPGNWGKLDIGGNMSSGVNFMDAMLNDVCDEDVALNSVVSPGTGFGGAIDQVFDEVLDEGEDQSMIVAANSDFGNGNSDVTILEFLEIDYIHDNGKSGANWQGTFRLIKRNATPPTGDKTLGGDAQLVF